MLSAETAAKITPLLSNAGKITQNPKYLLQNTKTKPKLDYNKNIEMAKRNIYLHV